MIFFHDQSCHSREGGNRIPADEWTPASAGVTRRVGDYA